MGHVYRTLKLNKRYRMKKIQTYALTSTSGEEDILFKHTQAEQIEIMRKVNNKK